jgi:menaquinone-9 beta-reductase
VFVAVAPPPPPPATALGLARAGRDVRLIDRAAFPRAKPCGECISPGAIAPLAALGVLDAVLALGPARLEGWRIFAPGGGRLEARFTDVAAGCAAPVVALAVERARFDAVLLDGALAAGARLRAPARVSGVIVEAGRVRGVIATDAGGASVAVYADLVIGADGLRSIVARALGLVARPPRLRKLSLTAHMPAPSGLDGFGELYLAAGACAGVAPVHAGAPRVCNVTLVASGTHADRGRAPSPASGGGTPATAAAGRFTDTLARFPALERRLRDAGAEPATAAILASGPFDVPVRRVAGPGFALVGDAAGYYDPFTGQGICHALLDAERLTAALLAPAAASAGDGSGGAPPRQLAFDAPLLRYARTIRRRRAETHGLQRVIERVVRSPALADRLIPVLNGVRPLAHTLLATTGDLLPPRALLNPRRLFTFPGP